MSPKECKQLHSRFFPIILVPIGFNQDAEAEAVLDTRQLWISEAVSIKSLVSNIDIYLNLTTYL